MNNVFWQIGNALGFLEQFSKNYMELAERIKDEEEATKLLKEIRGQVSEKLAEIDNFLKGGVK